MSALARVAALLLLLPAAAWADGAHGGHGAHGAGPQALAGPIVVQGYRLELAAAPAAPVVDVEGRLVARLWRVEPSQPVLGADVRIGVAPAAHAEHGMFSTVPVSEQTWAGAYTLRFRPDAAGAYRVRVVVAAAEGRSFDPPLVADFPFDVARAEGLPWLPLTAAALLALGAIAFVRARAARPGDAGLDALRLPWLARLLTAPVLAPALQLPVLVATAAVVFLGLADVQDAGVNVAPRLAWTIWWAGIIFTLVLAGRVWCVVCPFGALNEWTARLTGAWRRLPRAARNLWWATALFMALTWADEELGVVRRPSVTAWLLIGLAALAVAVGLRYERRSFCRFLCPIGGLLGLYSMTAPLELRARDGAVCRADRAKSCYRGGTGSRGCPMLEFPATLDRNNYCTFCLECARGCAHGNLALRPRAFGRDLWATSRRAADEAYLAVALVGLTLLVTARMLAGWPDFVSGVASWLPRAVRGAVTPVTYLTAVESAVLLGGALLAAPLLLLGAAALSDRLARDRAVGVRRAFVSFAYMFVPVALALHLAHNLSHLLVEGAAIVPAVQRAVAVYTPWTLGEPDWQIGALAGGPVVGLLQLAVVLGFFVLSLIVGHRLSLSVYDERAAASRALVPVAVLSLLFTIAGILVLAHPMALRHGL